MQKLSIVPLVSRFLPGLLVLATAVIPVALSAYDYSYMQLFLAMVLIDVCIFPTIQYLRLREVRLPVLSLICLAYALQFAMPIFTREPKQSASYDYVYLTDTEIIPALLMCIFGVVLLQMGYHLAKQGGVRGFLPTVNLSLGLNRIEAFCICAIALS